MKTFVKLLLISVLGTTVFGSPLYSDLEEPLDELFDWGGVFGEMNSKIESFLESAFGDIHDCFKKIFDAKKKEQNHNGHKSEVTQNPEHAAAATPAAPLNSGEGHPASGPVAQNPAAGSDGDGGEVSLPAANPAVAAAVGPVSVTEAVVQRPPQPPAINAVESSNNAAISDGSVSVPASGPVTQNPAPGSSGESALLPAAQNPVQPAAANPAEPESDAAAVGSASVPETVAQNPPQPAAANPAESASGGAVVARS